MSLRRAVARALERGAPSSSAFEPLQRLWQRHARIERPCAIPPRVCVITVGGATLGGSGRTPVAVAIARHLAHAGARVALVSHAHGAASSREARVGPRSNPAEVGDEAVESAVALEGTGAIVYSGRRREPTLRLAAEHADVLVVDGPVQLAPARAHLALLVVDAARPWGSGKCPPLGDLRAPAERLVAAADVVVRVATHASAGVADAAWNLEGAVSPRHGARYTLADLRRLRVGLVTNLARSGRVVETLRAHGVETRAHIDLPDHAQPRRAPRELAGSDIDVWLAPTKLRSAADWPATAWIEASLSIAPSLLATCERVCGLAP